MKTHAPSAAPLCPFRVVAALAFGLAFAAGPWALFSGLHLGTNLAFAHGGNGGGNGGGGNGGGNGGGAGGNGGGGGHGGGGGAAGNAEANGHGGGGHAGGQAAAAGHGPAGAPGHAGVAADPDQLASALGALNAAHANPAALAAAAPVSEVGRIAAYDRAMLAALALPDFTPAQIAVRDQAIAAARSTELAAATNKALSPSVVSSVDALLGLPPTDPTLGVAP